MTDHLTVAALAQAIGWAFAVGALLLLVLTLLPQTRLIARGLWPILISEVGILAAGVLPWFLPGWALFALLVMAASRIGFESGTIHRLIASRPVSLIYSLLLPAACAMAWFGSSALVLQVAAAIMLASLIAMSLFPSTSLVGSLARFSIFPLLPFTVFCHLAGKPGMAPLLVLAFFLVEMFDSFSLLGGKLIGRTLLVPRLSPRKTWEGLATGSATLLIAVLALVSWLGLPLLEMLMGGLVVIASAITGDLLGSAAKRSAGVKDYPPVMKIQGGLLDIIDSWIVAGPCLVGFYFLTAGQ